jgi:hypothetical protein
LARNVRSRKRHNPTTPITVLCDSRGDLPVTKRSCPTRSQSRGHNKSVHSVECPSIVRQETLSAPVAPRELVALYDDSIRDECSRGRCAAVSRLLLSNLSEHPSPTPAHVMHAVCERWTRRISSLCPQGGGNTARGRSSAQSRLFGKVRRQAWHADPSIGGSQLAGFSAPVT